VLGRARFTSHMGPSTVEFSLLGVGVLQTLSPHG
jgi:hypothetical protein